MPTSIKVKPSKRIVQERLSPIHVLRNNLETRLIETPFIYFSLDDSSGSEVSGDDKELRNSSDNKESKIADDAKNEREVLESGAKVERPPSGDVVVDKDGSEDAGSSDESRDSLTKRDNIVNEEFFEAGLF